MNDTMVGDRVWAYYREHSIPSKSLGTVIKVEGRWYTVKLDTETFEDGSNVVCTADVEFTNK